MIVAITANLGFPRLGLGREWKWTSEKFWTGKISRQELLNTADELTVRHWKLQADRGIEIIPCNDFAFYDQMLDTAVMVGAVPPRYDAPSEGEIDLPVYFAMARGRQDLSSDVTAMEMTKWFDTNYHYIVPEFSPGMRFRLASQHPFRAVERARAAGVAHPRPVLVGPATFLLLGKTVGEDFERVDLVPDLIGVYVEILARYQEMGVPWVQIDEPALVTDLDESAREIFRRCYGVLGGAIRRPKIMLATYFGGLDENADLALSLGAEGLHLDLVRAPQQLAGILDKLNQGTTMSLGVVDGRNVWRMDLDKALTLLRQAAERIGSDRLQVAPSCSLLHCPLDVNSESKLDPEIKGWLAFGLQKLEEVEALTRALNEGEEAVAPFFALSRQALTGRSSSPRVVIPEVRKRLTKITEKMSRRQTDAAERRPIQRAELKLPLFPLTTIGSFPQTEEIRKLRAGLKKGAITQPQLDEALRAEMARTIKFQEAAGLDVLVHGEFERNDMVEYFGEQMDGFVFTENAWVQSFGSRAVKPPIIFGDVQRRGPMTVEWIKHAQSLTPKPVKGMLTGPVTMMEWSFVRDDQPRRETCRQLALALREEVADLEHAGIKIIQIDEPALPGGLPLKRRDWPQYLNWAVDCFRLASGAVADRTQIHTHMCYCEFSEILDAIAALDVDVISFEGSRSRMEILDGLRRVTGSPKAFGFPSDVGPGVYDIHSPRVPSSEEIVQLLQRALETIPAERLWINPDCGLKTRAWHEIIPAIKNMVLAAKMVRKRIDHPVRVA
jgi:5-methyltetrahydropteroyltriglutamate--homocysteine methyltransferase